MPQYWTFRIYHIANCAPFNYSFYRQQPDPFKSKETFSSYFFSLLSQFRCKGSRCVANEQYTCLFFSVECVYVPNVLNLDNVNTNPVKAKSRNNIATEHIKIQCEKERQGNSITHTHIADSASTNWPSIISVFFEFHSNKQFAVHCLMFSLYFWSVRDQITNEMTKHVLQFNQMDTIIAWQINHWLESHMSHSDCHTFANENSILYNQFHCGDLQCMQSYRTQSMISKSIYKCSNELVFYSVTLSIPMHITSNSQPFSECAASSGNR